MKKWFLIFLVFAVTLMPVISLAAQSPLVVKGSSVYVPDESLAELVSCNIFFRIRTGYSAADTTLIVKNRDLDKPITFQMGMPIQLDSVSKVRNFSAFSDGKSIRVIQRSTLKNPPTEKDVDVARWYVWDVSLEPGESKAIDCSFSIDNKLESDGTEVISYPLNLLQHWTGNAKNLQIIADLDYYGPYAFDLTAPSAPTKYDDVGRLTYKWDNLKSIPATFELSFKPMDVLIIKYIESKSQSSKEIKSILDAYKNRSYNKAVSLIHEFLSTFEDTDLLSELKYLEALSYQSLFELDKALNIFNQLEPNPGFGGSLSGFIKNKIIYDKVAIFKSQGKGDEKALDYLKSVKNFFAPNPVFSIWLDKEITLLTPPVAVEEPPEEDIKNPDGKNGGTSKGEDPKIIDKFTIGKYEFYIEEILIFAAVLFVILIIIIKIIKRKRKKRTSIFRY